MADLQPTTKSWAETVPGDVLLVTDSYEDLLIAIRRRKETLGFTHEQFDERAGLPGGYCDKVLGPRRRRNLGPLSLGLFLSALGLKIAIVADKTPVPIRPKNCNQDRSRWQPGDPWPPRGMKAA